MSERRNIELVTQEEGQIDINALIPLGVQLLENSRKDAEERNHLQKESLRIKEKTLDQKQSFFRYNYWLLGAIVMMIFAITSGLTFIKDDITSGMSVLTHTGAIIMGILAGAGWEKSRDG